MTTTTTQSPDSTQRGRVRKIGGIDKIFKSVYPQGYSDNQVESCRARLIHIPMYGVSSYNLQSLCFSFQQRDIFTGQSSNPNAWQGVLDFLESPSNVIEVDQNGTTMFQVYYGKSSWTPLLPLTGGGNAETDTIEGAAQLIGEGMSFPAQLVSPSIQHEPDLADAVMDLHLIAEEALKKDYPEEGDFPDREMMQRVLSEPDAGADLIQGLLEKTRDAVDNLLSVAIDEDGLDREFPHSLREFVREHGLYGVLELATALGKHHNSEVVEETLIHLGAIEDDLTLEVRLSLLQQFLRSTDVGFRDAAGLGIAAMDEPSAIEDLREVIQSETAPRLRRNFNQIIEQLERTLECQVSGG